MEVQCIFGDGSNLISHGLQNLQLKDTLQKSPILIGTITICLCFQLHLIKQLEFLRSLNRKISGMNLEDPRYMAMI